MVSGPMAERAYLPQQILFIIVHTGLIYPIGCAWITAGGWLQQRGFHDFAGAGYVYLNGGTCGLIGAWLLGSRLGVIEKAHENDEDRRAIIEVELKKCPIAREILDELGEEDSKKVREGTINEAI